MLKLIKIKQRAFKLRLQRQKLRRLLVSKKTHYQQYRPLNTTKKLQKQEAFIIRLCAWMESLTP